MTCKASERVLSNFKTTLSWLGTRSYVVMLSEFWRIVWFAGNRGSVKLWFVVGVATLCSDAGEVNEELRLGVSGCTSLEALLVPELVGWTRAWRSINWKCHHRTRGRLDILELVWVGTAALWGAKLVGVYARALQRGGLLQHTNLKLEIFRVYWAWGSILFYILIIVWGTIWGILVESLIILISTGVISLIVLEVKIWVRHTIVIVLSSVVIRIITWLVSILIRIPVVWIIWTILIGRAITLLSIVATIVPRLLSLPIVAISRGCISVVIVPPGWRLFKIATTIHRGRPRPLSGLVALARFWRTAIATAARI